MRYNTLGPWVSHLLYWHDHLPCFLRNNIVLLWSKRRITSYICASAIFQLSCFTQRRKPAPVCQFFFWTDLNFNTVHVNISNSWVHFHKLYHRRQVAQMPYNDSSLISIYHYSLFALNTFKIFSHFLFVNGIFFCTKLQDSIGKWRKYSFSSFVRMLMLYIGTVNILLLTSQHSKKKKIFVFENFNFFFFLSFCIYLVLLLNMHLEHRDTTELPQ